MTSASTPPRTAPHHPAPLAKSKLGKEGETIQTTFISFLIFSFSFTYWY
jgi:hypothetical protein